MAIEVTPISSLSQTPLPLLTSQGFQVNNSFSENSKIELSVHSLPTNDEIYIDYNYNNFSPVVSSLPSGSSTNTISEISVNPTLDFSNISSGENFNLGKYKLTYRFYDNVIGSNLQHLYINNISSDRKELKLSSLDLTDLDIVEQTNNFIQFREDSDYFIEFLLNFGNSHFITCVNIKLDNSDPTDLVILIKTKDPLPSNYLVNDVLWIVRSLEEPVSFQITSTPEPILLKDYVNIKGPNFNLDVQDQINNSTLPLSYLDLISTTQTSSLNQVNSLLDKKELNINIDYIDFNNFVHFSSIKTRLENFQYKIGLIESYSSSIAILTNTSPSSNMSGSKASFEGKISNIINNFDGYEDFLYYDTGSYSYPKTTSQKPYQLAKSTSIPVMNWLGNGNENSPNFGGILASASLFDINNRNQLLKSIPEYLRDDPNNQQYELFVDMVAQYYDNIWIYLKDVTNKYDNDNRLNFGISKDLVADAIRDFGVKLYQNNFSNDDLYTAFLGLTPNGNLFPYPNMTGSLPTPTGFEYVDTLISASNDILPQEDVNKSLYKRIYHNLPYLLNSKGTIPGLRALITSYGIPDTILRINEYGGKDKINANDWDHWQNEFNYAFNTSGSNFISSSWQLNSDFHSTANVPETLMFRFKTNGLPTSGSYFYSQSLWHGNGSSDTSIVLEYTGSGYTSGSYNGSIKDPYYQYANLIFHPDNSAPSTTASVYLPFFDGEWWSVMVKWDGGSNFDLYSGNNLYGNGNNDTRIGFFESSSITGNKIPWINTDTSYFPISFSVSSPWGYDIVTYDDTAIYDGTSGASASYSPFSGSYQEIRYYATGIDENVFKDYVMNPYSIEGNTINSSPDELAFRASIGGELYTGSNSIHPKVTGSWIPTQSFSTGLSSFYYDSTPNFITNKEYFSIDQPVAGIKNVIGDKIRVENNTFPGGFPTASVLSPYKSLLQQTNASQSYTPNINYLEVAFSPQNQINEDIMSQLGFFNIGDYIGDPRLRSSSADSYPDLDKLRDDYFQKYIKNYNLKDFVRLIKFFDNSLFKMIKNFIPARTSLASGLVIKQHLLERDKYPTPQPYTNTTIAKYAKSGSIIYNQPIQQQNLLVSGAVLPQSRDFNQGTIVNVGGGTGGTFDQFNNLNTSPYGVSGSGPTNRYFLTQSWNEGINYISGSIDRIISNQDEFYDGEFSGSNIQVTTQSLAYPYPIILTDLQYKPTIFSNINYGLNVTDPFTANIFSNPSLVPGQGEVYIQMPYFTSIPGGTGFPIFVTTSPFMKIHKDDCNLDNQTVPLQNCTSLRIQRQGLAIYDEYIVKNRTEYQSYFLFELENNTGHSIGFGSGRYSEVKNYKVEANASTIHGGSLGLLRTGVKSYTVSTDILGYFIDPGNGFYILDNQPNIPLHFSASVTFGAGSGTCRAYITRNPQTGPIDTGQGGSIIAQNLGSGGSTVLVDAIITGSIGDAFSIQVSRTAGTATFSSATFNITQSVEPSSSLCLDVFLDPYVTQNNYYNSDFNPLMNNIMENRKNTIYQDVDYSLGVKPVNFEFLISGSAEKFPIPDSHYTQKSSVIPRYEGARSTSQKLNVWTDGDTGTYGKVPTANQLESKLVYADWIGGYPPEHMNASGIHIQYIINEDGTIKIPHTSENALEDVQQTFMSNRILEINSNTIGTGIPTPKRNIIRGGYRINPVLYTQSGSVANAPFAQWVTSIVLEDILAVTGSATTNYQVAGTVNVGASYAAQNRIEYTPYPLNASLTSITNTPSPTGDDYTIYTIPVSVLDENVTLNFQYHFNLEIDPSLNILGATINTPNPSAIIGEIKLRLKNGTTTLQTHSFPISWIDLTFIFQIGGSFTMIPQTIAGGNQLSYEYEVIIPGQSFTYKVVSGDVYVTQTPLPTLPINVGSNDIWGYPDKTLYPNTITSSIAVSSSLGVLFRDPNVQQKDIPNSGFNKIALPWSIEIGDEFRFEGVESNTFMVKKVYGIAEGSGSRFTPTGSIEVQFDKNLPVSASVTSFNLDHFLIRRYVPDASQIIMEGFKPADAVGPYIIKPDYVTSQLNKGIDDYILDLTNKGLI